MSKENEVRVRKRPMCERCLRPLTHCLCAWIPALESRTRVLVLQHPDESHHALNTARLAVLGLRNAVLHVGRQFDAALWSEEGYRPRLLFPGDGAQVLVSGTGGVTAGANDVSERVCSVREEGRLQAEPVLLIVPDGTWRHARQLLATHPELAALPRVTLPVGMTTRYRVRYAGEASALSTIEAITAALDVLDAPREFGALLAPFEKLVAGQIAAMGQDRYQRDHVLRAGKRAEKKKEGLGDE